MTVSYRQAASDDVVRQFRYYLVNLNLPEVAFRFRVSVQRTVQSLRYHPFVGPRYRSRNPKIQGLRTWPVAGFEVIRIYYIPVENGISVVRVLHGRRDIKRMLEGEGRRN